MNYWGIVILMLFFSAFFSGIEIAFVTANKLKIEIDKSKGLFSSKILSNFSKTPWKFISAVLLGNNIALVIYGIYMAKILEPFLIHILPLHFQTEFYILTIQSILATLLILITAEFLPKILFRINANATLNFFAVPATLFYYLLYPIVYIFILLSEKILDVFFKIKVVKQNQIFTPVDVDNFISEFSNENNENTEIKQELQMFQNVIDFRDVKLRECMIPRTEIVAVEKNSTIDEITSTFTKTGLSKILVYEESVDNIIGYVHVFDLFNNPENINSITKSVIFVPETMLAKKLLNIFIEQRRNVAIVVDEFGGTSGMLTLEDVIEEIFGEIEDEFDTDENFDKKVSENEYIFSGRHEIDYLNEKYNLNLPKNEDYETLAGLIIYFHKSIPAKREEITFENFSFIILEATKTKIEKVYIKIKTNS